MQHQALPKVQEKAKSPIPKSSFQRKKKPKSLVCTLPSAHAQKGINAPIFMTRITCTRDPSPSHWRRILLQGPQPFMPESKAVIAASSVVGTRGVCSLAAPHLEAESSGNAVVDTCRKAWRGLTKQGGSAVGKGKRVVEGALKQKYFGQPLFEKAFKCFAAMAMVCRVSTGISCRFWSW